ncbi:MAG: phage terminase large subunit [Isosphaeraceae bacterium]|nr:phage terminase large subunit [Isosphaeraceae bacterium]
MQSWDTASRTNDSNDWSACTTWLVREQQSYLLDVLRARLEFPDLRREIISRSKMAGADYVLIEDAGAGMHLIQDLNREGHVPLIPIRPVGEKIVRLQAATVAIEGRRVWLPESADWLADFLVEVLAFPRGRFDDQVDSLSQFLNWAANRSWEVSFEIINL